MTEIGGLKITRAYALSETRIVFSTMLSEWDDYESKSIIVEYNHGETDPWKKATLKFHTASICSFSPDIENPDFKYHVVMSSNGELCHYHPDGPFDEYIFGVGEAYDDSKDKGRLLTVRQIGSKLYACGRAGQIYVRDGKDNWKHLTKDLLWGDNQFNTTLDERPKNLNHKEFREWMKNWNKQQQQQNARIILQDINGPTENEIYICGEEGRLYFWNGEELEDLDPGIDHMLNTIHVSDDNDVWVCGLNGQILRGNEDKGFDDVSDSNETHQITSMTTYKGEHLFASQTNPFGLFEFNEEDEELERVTPRVKPVLRSIHTIQAVGDVLWVIGSKDILRLENGKWERIQHPDFEPR